MVGLLLYSPSVGLYHQLAILADGEKREREKKRVSFTKMFDINDSSNIVDSGSFSISGQCKSETQRQTAQERDLCCALI